MSSAFSIFCFSTPSSAPRRITPTTRAVMVARTRTSAHEATLDADAQTGGAAAPPVEAEETRPAEQSHPQGGEAEQSHPQGGGDMEAYPFRSRRKTAKHVIELPDELPDACKRLKSFFDASPLWEALDLN